jgi:hypothetical protein
LIKLTLGQVRELTCSGPDNTSFRIRFPRYWLRGGPECKRKVLCEKHRSQRQNRSVPARNLRCYLGGGQQSQKRGSLRCSSLSVVIYSADRLGIRRHCLRSSRLQERMLSARHKTLTGNMDFRRKLFRGSYLVENTTIMYWKRTSFK